MVKDHRHIVLVVEDETLVRLDAADAFQDGGFAVLEAEHAAGAILIALDNPRIDLLFTDVNMPGVMNGISLAEHLFALRPNMKIIITSALPLLREVDHLNARFLPKPYEVTGLCGLGEELLAAYPTALALAMVEKGLALRPRERLDMLAVRDDVLLLHRDLVDNVQGVLDALFGLNRVFAPHPFHKWLEWEATLIPLKPGGLVSRIRRLLVASPRQAVDEMSALAEETFDLVAAHLPEFAIDPVRKAFAFRRTA